MISLSEWTSGFEKVWWKRKRVAKRKESDERGG